jgi:hypothetical protein
MPSRRDVLALLAAAPLAGCSADVDTSSATDDPPLSGRTVTVVGDVPLPDDAGARRTGAVGDAEVVLVPPGAQFYDTALYALEAGTPVVVAGEDAPGTVLRLCERAGERYGVPSDSWTPSERVAAVVPVADRLVVQYVEPRRGADLAAGLPWAVGQVLDGRPPAFPVEGPPRPDGGVELGRVRVRGRVDVGDYDRWDRATLFPDRERAVVETVATVTAADAPFPDRYRVDEVSVRTGFTDATVEATGPAAGTDAFAVEQSVSDDGEVTHGFTPAKRASRRALTVGARTVVSLADPAPPFSYLGNVRCRWRDPRLLREDGTWVAHTPGRAVWRGF